MRLALAVILHFAHAQDVFIPAHQLRGSANASNADPVETMAKNTTLPNAASHSFMWISSASGALPNASLDAPVVIAAANPPLPNMTWSLSAEAAQEQCQKQCQESGSKVRQCQKQCQLTEDRWIDYDYDY